MGSVAFTTLVILLFATPGYAARMAYHSGLYTSEVIPKNLMDDIATALLFSLPFHILGMGIIEHAHLKWATVPGISFEVVFRLIAGDYGKDDIAFHGITANLYDYIHLISLYFLVLVVFAFGAGIALRTIVWNKELDVKYRSLFGYRNQWLYSLYGRGRIANKKPGHITVGMVDAIVLLDDKTRMYRGLVHGFTTDNEGTLKDITLFLARRGKFKPTKKLISPGIEEGSNNEAGNNGEFYWEQIPGDFFVLKYAEIKNMNVTYLQIPSSESR